MIEEIKVNNLEINKRIMEVIANMSRQNISAVEQSDNGTFKFKEFTNEILEAELEKIILTYCGEYTYLVDESKIESLLQTKLKVYESDELDAHGYYGNVEFSSGTSKCLNGVFKEEKPSNDIDYISSIKQKSFDYSLNRNSVVENNLDVRDYMEHAKHHQLTDLDFFLDCMPHELMHVFGFNGGMFEGVTESLTRQVASKYNIRCIPMGHKDETKFMQKIEKIIGTDKVIEYSYNEDKSSKDSNTNYRQISAELNGKLDSEGSLFGQICDIEKQYFSAMRSGAEKEELEQIFQQLKSVTKLLNDNLDDYIDRNQNNLYNLGENNISEKASQDEFRTKIYQRIIELQNREINMLVQLNIPNIVEQEELVER
ncbi:MAG: hypothetical protein RSE41_05970 [Clostridia bacterium]